MPETPKVSVIIAARNNAKYLQQAIESCIQQTIPCEIVYSDDCSTDNSLEIARQYKDRIIIVSSLTHTGVCETRNRGFKASIGNYVCFLDGDDWFPDNFIEEHLKSMEVTTPFTYGPAKVCGSPMDGHIYPVPIWDEYFMFSQNTVNTSALYSRKVFEACGGWLKRMITMWDYDLAIRASRFGTPKPSNAVLNYRHYGESWSDEFNERTEKAAIGYMEEIRNFNLKLSIGCVYSGRLPDLIPEFCSKIANAVRTAQLSNPCEIIVLDNSKESGTDLEDELNQYDMFDSVRVVYHPDKFKFETEKERRDGVANYMATASNRLLSFVHGDLVLLIEDDVLIPPKSIKTMLKIITSGIYPVAAVSGIYWSRHGTNKIIAGHRRNGDVIELDKIPEKDVEVDVAGTGCLMFWKKHPAVPIKFESHLGFTPAHDWKFCDDIRNKGGKIILCKDVVCKHVISMEERI